MDEHHVFRGDRSHMHLDSVGAVLEIIGLRDFLSREFSRLAGRNEACTQPFGEYGSHHKTAGFQPDNFGDSFVFVE